MCPSCAQPPCRQADSEDDNVEDVDFDNEDAELEAEDDGLDIGPGEATEEDSGVEDSDDASDEDEDEDDAVPSTQMAVDPAGKSGMPVPGANNTNPPQLAPKQECEVAAPSSSPLPRKRSLTPIQLRKKALSISASGKLPPRSFVVEAICAIPHPVPTHALAASYCMTHLLTGSDDGYIRDYDIFAAVNSKNFLTAPQRHHSGVGQLRCWWENSLPQDAPKVKDKVGEDESSLSPVYSLAMDSDALWALAGSDSGNINLFTVRHDPGRLIHVMNGHRGPVSALSIDTDEKGFFSAGWDGEVIQWDLNTGQTVRHFTAHGSQLTAVSLRPSGWFGVAPSSYADGDTEMQIDPGPSESMGKTNGISPPSQTQNQPEGKEQPSQDSDAKSDISFDPLFDDDPDGAGDGGDEKPPVTTESTQGASNIVQTLEPPLSTVSSIPPPKNAPPLLDPATYATYSPNVLMTAYIDGQVVLWDRRAQTPGKGVGRLWMSEKTPPWCLSACWSTDGNQLYAGRRNGAIDVWDVRQLGYSGLLNTPRLVKTLRNPPSSGVVSCVVALPDCRHIACASVDNLRLWNVAESVEQDSMSRAKGVQFKIIPGHHGGYVSQMIVDAGARFLVSASSNRGWHGESTKTIFVHDIKHIMAS
ncbi:WD40 repeat-like protein [Amanita rubescens]|nr:WD40 repeat-like protein [Amanita rubescens]